MTGTGGVCRGNEERTLAVGDFRVRLDGLDSSLAARLDARWGPFLGRASSESTATVEVRSGDGTDLLPAATPGERYRIEPLPGPATGIVSHGFCLAAVPGRARAWRLALGPSPDEPDERRVENAARYVVATLAIEAGGLAFHAAGVLAEGRGFLLAGPSRAGKSTAVRQCGRASRLGDDFGLVVPREGGWSVVAVPFDNAERIEPGALRGAFPLCRILRLVQDQRTRIEEMRPLAAAASLVSLAAFPWALPGRAAEIAEFAERVVAGGHFAHLHFARDADLLRVLTAIP